MKSFSAGIYKIGINPYVLLPENILQYLFKKAGKEKGFIPVSLGHTRLRTETAALVAAVIMCNFS